MSSKNSTNISRLTLLKVKTVGRPSGTKKKSKTTKKKGLCSKSSEQFNNKKSHDANSLFKSVLDHILIDKSLINQVLNKKILIDEIDLIVNFDEGEINDIYKELCSNNYPFASYFTKDGLISFTCEVNKYSE